MRNIAWYHSQLWLRRLADNGEKEMFREMRRKTATKQNCFHHSTPIFRISHCLIIPVWITISCLSVKLKKQRRQNKARWISFWVQQHNLLFVAPCLVKFFYKPQTEIFLRCYSNEAIFVDWFKVFRYFLKRLNEKQKHKTFTYVVWLTASALLLIPNFFVWFYCKNILMFHVIKR